MNLYARFLRALIRSSFAGTGGRKERVDPSHAHPRATKQDWTWTVTFGAAVPAVVGCALIPFRESFGVSSAIVFVLPTLFVALARGPLGALIAATTSAIMYNLLLTQPYYSLRIDESAEIVAMIVLFVSAAFIGITSTHLRDMTQVASTRRTDVDAFVALAARGLDADKRTDVTSRALTAILNGSSTQWLPGYHGTVSPVLNRDGTIAGRDLSALPALVEVPAKIGAYELGRFVVRSDGKDTSREERSVALALVDVFARFSTDPAFLRQDDQPSVEPPAE